MKTCSKCKETKELTEYHKHRYGKDGLLSWCKKCHRLGCNQRYLKNKPKYLESMKKYHKANNEKRRMRYQSMNKDQKEIYNKKRKLHYENNRVHIIRRNTDYVKNKINTNLVFKIKEQIRSLIKASMKNKKFTKKSRTHEILGCSFEDFKLHIERQFTKGMNWDNRDKWHIDHIIPMATAKTEEDVIRLNHYTNLRPLWAEENLSKSDKIITHQLVLL